MKKILIILLSMLVITNLFARPLKKTYEYNGIEKSYNLNYDEELRGDIWNVKTWEFQFAYDLTQFNITCLDILRDNERSINDYLRYIAPGDNFLTHIYTTLVYISKEYCRATIEVPMGDKVKIYRCDHVNSEEFGPTFRISEFVADSSIMF